MQLRYLYGTLGLQPAPYHDRTFGSAVKRRSVCHPYQRPRAESDRGFSGRIKIQGTDGTLSFAGYHTEGFSQNGHNGGDYIIIVPDAVLAQMHPYYAELVADIKGEAPADLEKRLDDLEKDPDKISVQGHAMTEAASDDWDGEALGNSCSGSDTIVTYTAKILCVTI